MIYRWGLVGVLLFGLALPGSSAGRTPRKFLIAADIHFNPFADLSLVPALAAAEPQQWQAIFESSKQVSFSQYGEDTNWWLLQSALDHMQSAVAHPALVMVAGDLLAHGFPQKWTSATHDADPSHYRAFVLKTVTFLSWQLRQRFPEEQILVTPGNNDDECGDYDVEADGPFLKDTAPLIEGLAREGSGEGGAVAAEWRALGSYSVRPRAAGGVRILSLNTVFFSNRYQPASLQHGCRSMDTSTAAARTLAWLEANLAQAKAAHQKVWLMLHIPPGIDGYSTMVKYRQLAQTTPPPGDICQQAIVPLWKPALTEKFAALLKSYQGTLTAAFAGHDHTDDLRIFSRTDRKAAFVLINPPISPIYGQNPGFRVVTLGKAGRVADHSTLYMTDLKTARGGAHEGNWNREYDFDQEWGGPRVDAPSLMNVERRVMQGGAARARWLTLLNVSSDYVHVPPAGEQVLTCAMGHLDPAQFQACYCPAPSPLPPTPK